MGDVFYLLDNSSDNADKKHRHVVIACDADEIITVSICTSHQSVNTCPIAVNDMDEGVLTVDSFIDYGHILKGSRTGLIRDLGKAGNGKLSTCSDSLMARILDGICVDGRPSQVVKKKFCPRSSVGCVLGKSSRVGRIFVC